MSARGLIIAAPRSGSGKTTLTLGLVAALAARGVKVRAVKSGPDYIDPAFHAAASGRPGLNLDSFAMPPALIDRLAGEAAEGAELVIVEASMGLFDGVSGTPGRTGAAADLAARLALPVVLVADISGQSQSAAAAVRGFATHDPNVRIAGVVLNKAASERHRGQASEAIAALGIPVLGSLPREAAVSLPERHLGLVQAEEHPDLATHFAALARFVADHVDLDALAALAAPMPVLPEVSSAGERLVGVIAPPGRRIALARDAAFSFIYEHMLAGWRRAGAEIVTFSPLADEVPPEDCDACWLPGGYPELHGARLAAAERFRSGMVRFAESRPVHGECGGYMVLGRSIEDAEGASHPMLGLLGHATSFAKRRLNLGYRRARLLAASPIGDAGAMLRGHEFHYATVIHRGEDAPLVELADGQGKAMGPAGSRRGHVSGSFFHVIAGDG
ncbi:cobyrinate a,c-diamide synthase [Bosea sp. 117]|uniref:cobyrinate a,c-diamide synthase n=1 Tax=Bosea sp. 117 TaxID=1125973 RepID=UPI0004941B35|nr:cobyrinate a,c-diamide synthase [Bosea sp. 117]